MTSEERARMNELCKRIQEEQNPEQLTALLEELNALLDGKMTRLPKRQETKTS